VGRRSARRFGDIGVREGRIRAQIEDVGWSGVHAANTICDVAATRLNGVDRSVGRCGKWSTYCLARRDICA
jgi:hypothetical protein